MAHRWPSAREKVRWKKRMGVCHSVPADALTVDLADAGACPKTDNGTASIMSQQAMDWVMMARGHLKLLFSILHLLCFSGLVSQEAIFE